MMFPADKKIIRLTFLLIIMLELASFFGWALPQLGNVLVVAVWLVVLAASVVDLRYGVAAMVAELLIGSHGYLFSLEAGGWSLSLRIGMFLVVCSVALAKAVFSRDLAMWRSPLRNGLIAIALAIFYAAARGLATGNGFANVFFDANAFIYFAAALPFWQAIRNREDLVLLVNVALGAALASIFKVLFLLYMFSHKLWWALPETYRWVRDTRIGELTQMTDTFFRIFFQSQVLLAALLFVVVLMWAAATRGASVAQIFRGTNARFFAIVTACLASILISLSRSNWMGLTFAAIASPFVLTILRWPGWFQQLRRSFALGLASMIAGIALIAAIVLVPFPPADGRFSASLFGSRAFTFDNEAGVGSRWSLLPKMNEAILSHPVLGSGLGKEVTYITQDPRLLAQNPSGEYTTFTFEWGYHDIWLKFGLFGVAAYAYLLWLIFKQWLTYARAPRNERDATWPLTLVAGLSLGLIAILVTHTTSPYINHPLGIGYLLFFSLVLTCFSIDKQPKTS